MARFHLRFWAACIYCAVLCGEAVADDGAAVRRASERYVELIAKKDASGLDHILDSRYKVIGLPPLAKNGGKASTIDYWINSRKVFVTVEDKIESLRIFGDTTIETGALFATQKALDGSLETWGGLNYTRIWVKDCEVWRLVHEHY